MADPLAAAGPDTVGAMSYKQLQLLAKTCGRTDSGNHQRVPAAGRADVLRERLQKVMADRALAARTPLPSTPLADRSNAGLGSSPSGGGRVAKLTAKLGAMGPLMLAPKPSPGLGPGLSICLKLPARPTSADAGSASPTVHLPHAHMFFLLCWTTAVCPRAPLHGQLCPQFSCWRAPVLQEEEHTPSPGRVRGLAAMLAGALNAGGPPCATDRSGGAITTGPPSPASGELATVIAHPTRHREFRGRRLMSPPLPAIAKLTSRSLRHLCRGESGGWPGKAHAQAPAFARRHYSCR